MTHNKYPLSPLVPLLAASLLALVCPGVASAGIIITNYPPANDNIGSTIAASPGGFSKAAGFTLPAGQPFSLDSVTLRLDRNDADATMQLDLFGDSGGNPVGPPLVSFVIPPFPVGVSDVTFFPATPFTLQPSTTYWLAATGSSPTQNGIEWLASDPGITPTGIATSAGYRFNNTGVYPPTGVSMRLNTFQVNGTPAGAVIPEPSTLVLLGMGSVSLLGYRWQRRRRTAKVREAA